MPSYEYKSITREHTIGTAYGNIDDLLNIEGEQGWQLVGVTVIPSVLISSIIYEVFYLIRPKTGPAIPMGGKP